MKPVLETVVRLRPAVCSAYASARITPAPRPARYPDFGKRRRGAAANGARTTVETANRSARNVKSGKLSTAFCTGTNV